MPAGRRDSNVASDAELVLPAASNPNARSTPATPGPASMLRTTLRGRCPRCGQGRLFRGFTHVAEVCPECQVRFDPDGASLLAGMILVYAAALIATLVLAIVLRSRAILPGRELWALLPFLVMVTLAFYRPAKAWWLWLMHRGGEMQTDAERDAQRARRPGTNDADSSGEA